MKLVHCVNIGLFWQWKIEFFTKEKILISKFFLFILCSMLKLCWQIFVESHLWTKVFYLAKFAFTNFWILISKKPLILREAKKNSTSILPILNELMKYLTCDQSHSVEKTKIHSHLKNFSWNQFGIRFVGKYVDFTEFLLEIQERSKIHKILHCACAQVISLWKIQFTHQTSIWGTFFITLEQVLHSAQSMIAQCGNHAIWLLSRFFNKNFVNSTFLLTNYIVNWFHEKFFKWERIFVFSTLCLKWYLMKRKFTSQMYFYLLFSCIL